MDLELSNADAQFSHFRSPLVWPVYSKWDYKWHLVILCRMYRFLIVIEKANGNFSAYSPDLPGCVATGKT
jgi:hypothetical protein